MEGRREESGREGEGGEEVLITFLTNIQKLIICSNSLNIIAQGETYIFLLTLISFYILSHSKAILKSSAHFLHTLRCLCYMFVKLTISIVFKIKLTCMKSTCQGHVQHSTTLLGRMDVQCKTLDPTQRDFSGQWDGGVYLPIHQCKKD